MKQNAVVAGVGMTHFGKHLETGLKAIGAEAVQLALQDAGLRPEDIQAAWVGNAAAGLVTGQECIRGQVILRSIGMGRIPVVNVENACASGSTAVQQAATMITLGGFDVVLALGAEKLYSEDRKKSFAAFSGGVDVELMQQIMAELQQNAATEGAGASGAGEKRSMFMDIYASVARSHMEKYGTTAEQFAMVSAKNSLHGSLNPRAQFREEMTVQQVLEAPVIAAPLTRPMCSPIGDGAAAVVLVSERKARELGITRPVRIVSSVLRSGWDRGPEDDTCGDVAAREAYEEAGLGPSDLSVIELHDASAPGEIMAYDYLGLCPKGEGGRLVQSGATRLGGRQPVNTSGGLLRKGHPVGATGVAQIVELSEQLQGRSGARQVAGARIALAHNGGGHIGTDVAALCVSILKV